MAKIYTNSLLTGSATYLFSNILNAAIPFALLPILTRYLNPTEYGEVAMFQTLVAGLAAFTGLSAQGAANRKYFDYGYESTELKDYISACMQILLASSLLIFFVLLIFKKEFSAWLGLSNGWILMATATSAAVFIANIRMGQWQVRKKAIKYSVFQVSQSVSNVILSLYLVVLLRHGADGRIFAQAWVPIFFAGIALIYLQRDKLINLSWHPEFIKEALSFGVPLIPHVAGIFLLNFIDRIIINSKLGLAQTGIYMVAVQLTMAMGIIFDAFNKAYVPWLFERLARNNEFEKQEIVKNTYLYFLGALIMAGIAFMAGPYIVSVIAGDKYRQAGEVIGWLALGQAFNGMYLMVTNYIFYSKKTGLLAGATISSGLINLLLMLSLIKILNLQGAAIAFAISMLVRFLLTWFVAQQKHPMPWLCFKKNSNIL